jgi:hypothetical protein
MLRKAGASHGVERGSYRVAALTSQNPGA